MNGPPHLLGEVSNTSKTAQLKELRRFLFKRKFIWVRNSILVFQFAIVTMFTSGITIAIMEAIFRA